MKQNIKEKKTATFDQFFEGLVKEVGEEREITNIFSEGNREYFPHIGTFQTFLGYDEEREERYISYRDYWDLDTPVLKEKGIDINQYNYPFHFYGRIYKSEFDKIKREVLSEELR